MSNQKCRFCTEAETIDELIAEGKAEEGDVLCDCAEPLQQNCQRPKCGFSAEKIGDMLPCCCSNASGPTNMLNCKHFIIIM